MRIKESSTSNSLQKRVLSIELMRVIACIFVICIHIGSGIYINGSFSKPSTFLTSIFADAVAMFWFITGAFIFKKDDYVKKIKSTLKKVLLPAILLILFIFFLDGWMFEGQTITESISNSIKYIPSALDSLLLQWATPVAHTGQFWYIFAYILVIICFPIIKAFVDKINETHAEKPFLVISFGLLLLNDISNNRLASFNHSPFGALIPAIILVIWGHIFYKNKDKILKKIKIIHPIIILLVSAIIRTLLIILFYHSGDNNMNKSILYWFSCFGLLTSTSLFFLLEISLRKISNSKPISWLILKIGSYTFLIYLLHELIIDFLKKFGLYNDIRSQFLTSNNVMKVFLYYIILSGIVFLTSLLVSIALRFLSNLIKKTPCTFQKKVTGKTIH